MKPNRYRQQAVSSLTQTPSDMFQGNGDNFRTLGKLFLFLISLISINQTGFEYWSDPNNRQNGFVNWQVDGQQTSSLYAPAVGPDQGTGGSGVGQRLIPEEPMAIILNLGISRMFRLSFFLLHYLPPFLRILNLTNCPWHNTANWQPIDLSTMTFPAEYKVDYIRVYQRTGQTNTGCNPKNYPTADYINNHLEAYTSAYRCVSLSFSSGCIAVKLIYLLWVQILI